jgi:CDP-diacylglycerol---serine O-phosphatidyltransferase
MSEVEGQGGKSAVGGEQSAESGPASRRPSPGDSHRSREHRRRRIRRHGRRAYIRSVYFLPSLCTLGNAICGFAAIYVTALQTEPPSPDALTQWFAENRFVVAAWLIFGAMVFDALDGRLARFTRHTTDFGGQLDSLADVISFGVAPAFLALQYFKSHYPLIDPTWSRLMWAIGALYVSCAAVRLARFNVSNEHGEQHHFSFLGLPSPAAGAAVAVTVLAQHQLSVYSGPVEWVGHFLATVLLWMLPVLVFACGLLMISHFRYPHPVNRYLRGRKSLERLILAVVLVLLLVVGHVYVLAVGILGYALWGVVSSGYVWVRRSRGEG